MKAEILKIAGVKSEKEFYKKFPTEESFIKVHGKALKKAQIGAMIQGSASPQSNPQPINFQQLYDQNDMSITGSTQDMRDEEALKMAQFASQQKGAKNGKKLKKALFGDETMPMGKTKMGNILGGVGKGINKAGGPMAVAQSAGDIVGGIQQMKGENYLMKKTQQWAEVSGVGLEASMTRPEQEKRKYVRPDDPANIVQPGQLYNPLGYGTNVLAARNGTEIANTFAPNTIYTDLGYAADGGMFSNFKTNPDFLKMNSSGQKTDIFKFAEQGGGDVISQLTSSIGNPKGYGPSGASRVGGGVGKIAGTIFGGPVGGFIGEKVGQIGGDLLSKTAEDTEQARRVLGRNLDTTTLNQSTQLLQQQNSANMRDGGIANPQVINQFGEYKLSQLLQPDPTMDTLRAGGHLKSYTPPSERAMYTGREQFAMGGKLKTHWGGYAEPISYNPYLPEEGETVKFRGNSHDESDGKGRTGIGVSYGDTGSDSYTDYAEYGTDAATGKASVEVEPEPAVQLKDGNTGDTSLTVYGNLVIPKFGAEMIGNSKAAGKKFKNYVTDLSKNENKQNKIIEKSVDELDSLDVNNPYDLLKFRSYEANRFGANANLKMIADEKIKLANLQSAINDTAEEYGFEADALAKGKVKKAQKGTNVKREEIKPINIPASVDMAALRDAIRKRAIGEISVPQDVIDKGIIKTRPLPPVTPEEELGLITIANQIVPYLRPSNAQPLDASQLAPEMFALATNQVDPVQAQTIQPELSVPYDVSLQDILNENEADYRAAVRLSGYNPAALGFLNAQKYDANQKVLGEQFRLNQAMRDKVFAENRNLLYQSNLQNLGILDQQYGRQQQALSNTKATTQSALSSIASKYAQKELENRTYDTYKNLFPNFDFVGRNMRAINTGLAQFNPYGSGMSGMSPYGAMSSEELEMLALQQKLAEKQQQRLEKSNKPKTSKNGALVKAIKSM